VAIGVKDVFAHRARALLTVAGLALTVITVVVALGTEAIYDAIVADPARGGVPFDLSVRAATLDDAAVRAFVERERGVARAFTVSESTARLVGTGALTGDSVTVRAVGDVLGTPPAAASYPATAGRRIAATGEALADRRLLSGTGLRIGDRVTVSVGGRPMSVRIVGRGIEPRSPDSLTVTADTLPARVPEEGLPLTALVLRPGVDAHEVAGRLERVSQGRLDVTVIADLYAADRDGLRPVLAALDTLLLLIALVNLMTTMLLGARERARDLALLKAVGMTPRQVVAGMASGAAVLACLGVAAGIPLGLWLFHALVRFASPSDAADITVDPSAASLLLLVPGAIAVATIAAALVGRRVARLPVVRALSDE
jgi:putative ABC transport system permease protein